VQVAIRGANALASREWEANAEVTTPIFLCAFFLIFAGVG
jgi:hypothetical protein